ncbi:hypothetical protein JOF56_003044 [Kibdelosporangium banguiense]|uniref:Uncharacterized protein n=1 Tax=Kibdelosporangium banguiense TaxID=1365924 RepID=A0ABS4TF93_9PSEU|nr:hypothetical protein [Kibdelosporangium banguiense]
MMLWRLYVWLDEPSDQSCIDGWQWHQGPPQVGAPCSWIRKDREFGHDFPEHKAFSKGCNRGYREFASVWKLSLPEPNGLRQELCFASNFGYTHHSPHVAGWIVKATSGRVQEKLVANLHAASAGALRI